MVIRYTSIFALLLFLNGTAFASQPVDQKKLEIEELEKQMQSFRGKVSLYKKCLQGKCSEQERKVVAQEAWQDGKKLLGAIAVVGGSYIIYKYWPKSFKQTLVDNQQKIAEAKNADEIFRILGWNLNSVVQEFDADYGKWLEKPSFQGWTLITDQNKNLIERYGFRVVPGYRELYKIFPMSDLDSIRVLRRKILNQNNWTVFRFGTVLVDTNFKDEKNDKVIKDRIIILRLPIDTYQRFKK